MTAVRAFVLESKVSFKAVWSCKEPQKSKKSPVTLHQDEEEGLLEQMGLISNHEMMVSKALLPRASVFTSVKWGPLPCPTALLHRFQE